MKQHIYFYIAITFFLPFISKAQLVFSENKGQWDKRVLFQTNAGNSSFFLTNDGYTVLIQHPEDFDRMAEYLHGHVHDTSVLNKHPRTERPSRIRAHAYRVKFKGAGLNTKVIQEKPVPGYENYFIGSDPSKWASGCKSFQAVTYKNIYPGIDLRYYVQDQQLKYDLIVYPGADVSRIQLAYEGADGLALRGQELVVSTSVGEARELKPYSYQFVNGSRQEVFCRYKISGNNLGFDVRDYDKSATLIIDPTLVFSSYTRSTGDNWGFTATPGPDGSMFGGGIAASTGFPVTTGAFQTIGGGPSTAGTPPDIAIMKLSPDGRTRIYATYIGGTGLDQPHSLIADGAGNLVIAGRTSSGSSFPGTLFGAGGGYDIFVCKLNATGTALIGSVRIGGAGSDGVNISDDRQIGAQSILRNYGDDGRSEVILDQNNNIFVASCTRSNTFFIRNGFQTTFGGNQDGVILKLNPNCNDITWSTFLGTDGDDAAFVLTKDPVSGDIFVGGGTTANGLPGTGAGVIRPAFSGGTGTADGFIARIRDNGNSVSMIRSTYLGTDQVDIVYGIQFDKNGFPYVMGTTTGSWPVVNAAYSNRNAKQFIAKLRPDLSDFVYSTTFGSVDAATPNISPVAFLVDNCENVYVSGWGGGVNRGSGYPSAGTNGMALTPDAFQSQTDGSDFYFFVLKKNASDILYGSFFGQRGGPGGFEHVDGGTSRFDAQGVIYQAACANCKAVPSGLPAQSPFPITAGVYGNVNPATNGGGCNLAMIKMRFDLAGVDVGIRAVGARQLNFCLPATVEFADTLRLARQYIWIWGDGTPNDTTTANPRRHTFSRSGFFDVKVIGIDSNSCNIKDSAVLRINVTTDSVAVRFNANRLPPCNSLAFQFTNTTDRLTAIPPFTNRSFVWEWGDGSRSDTVPGFAPNPINHTFPGPGSYNVRLRLIDTNFCNLGDTFGIVNFQVAATIRAGFSVQNGCIPYTVAIRDTSAGASTYLWVSSDGQSSTNTVPSFVYNRPGTYTLKQYIFNSNSCNLIDSAIRTIQVFSPPTAGFTYSPNPSQDNTPTRFNRAASPDVVSWLWDFGDGDTSRQPNPIHQYTAPGTYDVCQVVANAQGCTDTLCMPVEALITIINDLPSAFTPNGDGVNDIFMVRGFGISKMTLRVYNRQGLLVFESRTPSIGWDGTYKGVPQPMDAYAWTLDVEYFTGEKVRKKGDVTLIR